jgi:hypothetical protein
MIKLKILGAVAIISAVIATPVFAHAASVTRHHHARAYDQWNFRGANNQLGYGWSAGGNWRDAAKFEPAGN